MKKHLKQALDYIRETMDEDDLAILHAEINKCYNQHLVPNFHLVNAEQVLELLGEYGEENDLPDDWWEEFDETDILLDI